MKDINWDEVESAEAHEDGLHVKMRDGTLGVLAPAPGAINAQRQAVCSMLNAAMSNIDAALKNLLQTKELILANPHNPPPPGTKEELGAAIKNAQESFNGMNKVLAKHGCPQWRSPKAIY